MSTPAEQTTVAAPVTRRGVGLHTGARTALRLLPAEPNAGIVFVTRSGAEIPATADHVAASERATTLAAGEASVRSVEHLLAALYALGPDNVRIEVDGPELPACDGSALEWVGALAEAGQRPLGVPRRSARLPHPVWAGQGASWSVAVPADRLALAVAVEFEGTVAGRQVLWVDSVRERFERELAPARTFALADEVARLRAAGLALGGGADNAFAVGPDGYSGPLRFPDEVVRHKALDLIGDLALCGARFEAQVFAVRPSHSANVQLARALRAAFGAPAAVGPTTAGQEGRL